MFEFRNIKTNKTYTLNEIDEIAANFWGVEVDERRYACPPVNGQFATNWFDILGHAIEDLQYFNTKCLDGHLRYHKACEMDEMHNPMFKFDDIVPQLISNCIYADSMRSLEIGLEYCKPYIELCYHLKSMDIVGVAMGW
jgi:hypothetical protein